MKFGIREIADVVFKAKKDTWIGNSEFKKGQPVLYIDSAKTSTIESAATTVYATGGRGNSRLITWEGEKTLTFTVEDALLSPIGFSILSGAGLFNADTVEKAMVHRTEMAEMIISTEENKTSPSSSFIRMVIYVDALTSENNNISNNAPIYVSILENGSLISGIKHLMVDTAQSNRFILKAIDSKTKSGTYEMIQPLDGVTYDEMLNLYGLKATMFPEREDNFTKVYKYPCIVDYYTEKTSNVTELVIDADNFGGYYYVEGTTYVRNENGKDMKMTLTFPKVKVQSNFTFNMASSGDPSTFSFVMDAMPDYTMFEATKKVLCAMQLIEEEEVGADMKPVLTLGENESVDSDITGNDSADWGGIKTESITLETVRTFNISNLTGREALVGVNTNNVSTYLAISGDISSVPISIAAGQTKTLILTNNNATEEDIQTTLQLLEYNPTTLEPSIIAELNITLKPIN